MPTFFARKNLAASGKRTGLLKQAPAGLSHDILRSRPSEIDLESLSRRALVSPNLKLIGTPLEAVANPGPEFVILVALSTTCLHVRRTEDGLAVRRVLGSCVPRQNTAFAPMLC